MAAILLFPKLACLTQQTKAVTNHTYPPFKAVYCPSAITKKISLEGSHTFNPNSVSKHPFQDYIIFFMKRVMVNTTGHTLTLIKVGVLVLPSVK